MLLVHRKRGFISSVNSNDSDQLLHLSSHKAYSLHLHQQGIMRIIEIDPGKCLHCWGVQAELRSKAGQNLHARLCNHKNLYISLLNEDRLDYADGMQAKLILHNCH